jgi:predicted aspartyl protease
MGLIYKKIVIKGTKGHRKVRALFDTGASESFIKKDIAEGISTLVELSRPKMFETVVGNIRVQYAVIPDILLDGHDLFWTLIVVDGLTEDVILGADFFQRWKIRLDPETEDIVWDPGAFKLKLV